MRYRSIVLLAVLVLVAGACADDTEDATDTPEPEATAEAPEGEDPDGAAGEATVAVASSDLGDILVDGEGLTLYVFLPDEQSTPTCTGDCLDVWPVLEGAAEAGDGADAASLGTVEHPEGATQVTYNDWPLYYFANDAAPGDTNGQGIGDNWYVVSPAGEPITE